MRNDATFFLIILYVIVFLNDLDLLGHPICGTHCIYCTFIMNWTTLFDPFLDPTHKTPPVNKTDLHKQASTSRDNKLLEEYGISSAVLDRLNIKNWHDKMAQVIIVVVFFNSLVLVTDSGDLCFQFVLSVCVMFFI